MNCVTDSKHWRTRGTRRGADDVLSAAQRDAQTGAADEARPTSTVTTCRSSTTIFPIVTLETARRRRRRFGSFVASAGIAALVGVGVLAVTAMFGSGGAGSPEGAVRQLADAVEQQGSARRGRRARAVRSALDARDRQARDATAPPSCKIVERGEQAARRRRPLGRPSGAAGPNRSPTATRRSRSPAARSRRARTERSCRRCSRRRRATARTAQGKVDLAKLADECRPPDVRRHRSPGRRLVREPGVHRARVRPRGQPVSRRPTSVPRKAAELGADYARRRGERRAARVAVRDWDRLIALGAARRAARSTTTAP